MIVTSAFAMCQRATEVVPGHTFESRVAQGLRVRASEASGLEYATADSSYRARVWLMLHKARFERQNDGLHPVANREFGQDVPHVCLDRRV